MPAGQLDAPAGRARAVLIDVGGVLLGGEPAPWPAWSARLGISPASLLGAVFGGSDDRVLIGAMNEDDWWDVVRGRLGIGANLLAGLRRDLASWGAWDRALLGCLGRVRGRARTAVVSNCWPHMRGRLVSGGVTALVDDVVLSCEAGWAKPDPRIYAEALARLGAEPGDALFVDDTEGNVAAARSLGLAGHQHVAAAGTIAAIGRFLAPGP